MPQVAKPRVTVSAVRRAAPYLYLDLVPKGRDEAGLAHTQAWVRHHDRYGD